MNMNDFTIPTGPPKLLPRYAETSTRRRPKEPATVVVGEAECAEARYVGQAVDDGLATWLCWRIGRRYYFQNRPW